jgi:Zn-dependent protease
MGDIDIAVLVSHLVMFLVVLLMAVSIHEAGHAWMSHKFGDDTAYMLGRVTLNPVAHTDPIGTLLIPILGFTFGAIGGALAGIPLIGWGKPTPVNPRNWTNYKLANVMVSIAGIGANLILAIIGFTVFKSLLATGVLGEIASTGKYVVYSSSLDPIVIFLNYVIMLNVSLAVFNLLPFPPLDGSKVLSTFLPASFQPVFDMLEQFGFLILLLLVYMGIIGLIIRPVYMLVQYLLFTPWF